MNSWLLVAAALLTAQPPAAVMARADAYRGSIVEWIGRQLRTSRIPATAPAINSRLFIAVDADGAEIPGAFFIVDGVAEETEAARKLGRSRVDRGIRRVRGSVSGVAETYHNNRPGTPGVRLTRVTLDAP